MKKIVSLLISSSMVFAMGTCLPSIPVSAASTYDVVQAKHQLVAKAIQSEKVKVENGTKTNYSKDQIKHELMYLVAHNTSDSKLQSTMQNMGAYELQQPSTNNLSIIPTTSTHDITMTPPSIFYMPSYDEWWVTGGGYWNDFNWQAESLMAGIIPTNIGGQDGYGVAFTNTSDNYNSAFVGGVCDIYDTYDNNSIETVNRSDGNGAIGFGFRLQDYTWDDWTHGFPIPYYKGSNFAVIGEYDSNFANYHGVATSYYIHTWDKTSISNITFGVQGETAGMSVQYTDKQEAWPAYSTDTRF